MKNLPAVDLEVEVFHEVTKLKAGQSAPVLIRIRNNSDAMAFFAGLKVKGIDEVTTQIYSDNWFPVLPKTEKQVWVKLVNDKHAQGSYQAHFEISGWNVKKKKIGSAFKMVLK